MKHYKGLCKIGLAMIDEIPFHVIEELTLIYVLENDLILTDVAGSPVMKAGDIEILDFDYPVWLKAASKTSKVLFCIIERSYVRTIDETFEQFKHSCNLSDFFPAVSKPQNREMLVKMFLKLQWSALQNMSIEEMKIEINLLIDYIKEFFNDIGHMFVEDEKKAVNKERFIRINNYITNNITEKITLNEIAKREHLNMPYLSQEFNIRLNKNYNEIINYYRVISVVAQLLNTTERIADIAENSGFSSAKYFNKIFKLFLGCSPSAFRKQHKGKVENISIGYIGEDELKHLCNDMDVNIGLQSIAYDLSCRGESIYEYMVPNVIDDHRDIEIQYNFKFDDFANRAVVIDLYDENYQQIVDFSDKFKAKIKVAIKEKIVVPKRLYIILKENQNSFQFLAKPGERLHLTVVTLYNEQ